MEKYRRDYSVTYKLTQIIEEPISIPDATGHQADLLELFLTSCSEKGPTEVLLHFPRIIYLSASNLMPKQRHPAMCRSIERFFGRRKPAGTASELTWRNLLSQPSSNILFPKLLPMSRNGSFSEIENFITQKNSSKNRVASPPNALQS